MPAVNSPQEQDVIVKEGCEQRQVKDLVALRSHVVPCKRAIERGEDQENAQGVDAGKEKSSLVQKQRQYDGQYDIKDIMREDNRLVGLDIAFLEQWLMLADIDHLGQAEQGQVEQAPPVMISAR